MSRATLISRPLTASFCTLNLRSVWVLLSFPEASLGGGVLFPKGKAFHWSSQKQRQWALRLDTWGLTSGAHTAEWQNSPFNAPLLFLLLLLLLRSMCCCETEKMRTCNPNFSLPSLDKHQTLSVNIQYDFLHFTNKALWFSFLSLIFKADKHIFCSPSLKSIKKDFHFLKRIATLLCIWFINVYIFCPFLFSL